MGCYVCHYKFAGEEPGMFLCAMQVEPGPMHHGHAFYLCEDCADDDEAIENIFDEFFDGHETNA